MQPISILIADDDMRVRQCLRRAVEQDPRLHVLWEADNGLKALCLAKQHQPQVVLLDAQMPRMDGIEAARCLRQRNHDLHIVVMSVYEHLRAQALAAGADAFLTKDCGCEALRATIHGLFDGKEDDANESIQDARPQDNTAQDNTAQDNMDENPEPIGVTETRKHEIGFVLSEIKS
jgi:DNA-binding NarL/FixJ family response regulator